MPEYFERIQEMVESFDNHLGRQILKNLRRNADQINQINMTTEESETHGSVRLRSVRVAQALTARGIGLGKVLVLCGANHNDISIPMASALYIGTTIMALSVEMSYGELEYMLTLGKPDIIFCDSIKATEFQKASAALNLSTEIVVFGEVPEGKFTPFSELLAPTGKESQFHATDFDPATTTAFIVLTSGTMGLSKGVCLTHQNIIVPLFLPLILNRFAMNFDFNIVSFSSLVWLSGIVITVMSDLFGSIRVQTHLQFTPELAFHAIHKYKPHRVFLPPTGILSLLENPKIDESDFSSIKIFACAGGNITYQKMEELQKYLPNGTSGNFYGMTEAGGGVCRPVKYKRGSCGQPLPWFQWKVVDVITKKKLDIEQTGELYIKSPWALFKGYYHDHEATANAFDGDWYKTGDLVYYDKEGDFFVVDRIEEMIHYQDTQVAPAELEQEIVKISGVNSVCVVGVPQPEGGMRPGAFVQRTPGSNITGENIQEIINRSMPKHKHLDAGVVFLDQFPATHSGKINRKALHDNVSAFLKPFVK